MDPQAQLIISAPKHFRYLNKVYNNTNATGFSETKATYDVYELREADPHLDDEFVWAVGHGADQLVVGQFQ